MPRKTLPRLRSVTIKGKEFHQVSVPQPGGGRRLRTFKDAAEAKRFYSAVQDEISRLALYSLGGGSTALCVRRDNQEIKPKTISIH
jgi:hypothetical protein